MTVERVLHLSLGLLRTERVKPKMGPRSRGPLSQRWTTNNLSDQNVSEMRWLLLHSKLTYAQLAVRFGVAQETVRGIERGTMRPRCDPIRPRCLDGVPLRVVRPTPTA